MRADAVKRTFRRVGKFFSKIASGGFSFARNYLQIDLAQVKAVPIRNELIAFSLSSRYCIFKETDAAPNSSLQDFAHRSRGIIAVQTIKVAIGDAATPNFI